MRVRGGAADGLGAEPEPEMQEACRRRQNPENA